MISPHRDNTRPLLPTSQQTTQLLFEEVYDELRTMAARLMLAERLDHTLSATALVNESYLRLTTGKCDCWDTRGHFFSAVAESMRRILIDRARARNTQKRGSRRQNIALEQVKEPTFPQNLDIWLLELNDGIERLEQEDPEAAEFVKLRVFAGCSVVDAGTMLGLNQGAAYRMWEFVRRWFATEGS